MSAILIKSGTDSSEMIVVLTRTAEDAQHPFLQAFRHVVEQKMPEKENGIIVHYQENGIVSAVLLKAQNSKTAGEMLEEARQKGGNLTKRINHEKCRTVTVLRASASISKTELLAFAEGLSLANYQFLKYKSEKKENTLNTIRVDDHEVSQNELDELKHVIDANQLAKDLSNEPVIGLNSVQLGEIVIAISKELNFKAEVLQKQQIEALKMGGLLGVNYGSSVPPTFSILEYKPENAKNKQPFIFIGKGVTYDTGGYSLKPANSMSGMKMDMSGAAAVIGSFYAIAKNKLPVYCVGLIPSTDNKVISDALVPDDVITMHSGNTIEVLNTDAEGRLILADALTYAKKYQPELVIDLATLTGAAAVITGTLGSAVMGTDYNYRKQLIECGEMIFERLWEIPYWKEYADMLKSDVADMKNIGGPVGGSATAGKFLEYFTDYPWLHIDIAGPAILKEEEPYKQKGASGVGVRLLYAFAKMVSE